MKYPYQKPLLALLPILAAVLFLGNSGGTARNGNYYTGAPSAGGGTESTCSTCHSGGTTNFGRPQIAVSFAADGETGPLTAYVPGQTYTVTVAVGYENNAPAAYGFSSQFLGEDNNTAGTAANPSDNAQVTAAGNGRTYVEQSQPSTDSLFTFEWTAPEAGAGAVSYYVSGNLVNLAAGTGGDSGSLSPTVVTLAEGAPSSVGNLTTLPLTLAPNPARERATLTLTLPEAGQYRLTLFDTGGRVVRYAEHWLSAGEQSLEVRTAQLPAGTYVVQLNGAAVRAGSRLVVR